jgi:predicted unusual protein kinase regulating ubiquinone biosynthesis (AarF/ABC1/UbiB family)
MVTDFIDGIPLEALKPSDVDYPVLLEQTRSLLRDLSRHGVAHGDLGHDHWQDMGRESNLLWTPTGRLVAIDFAGSVPRTSRFFLLNGLYRALAHHDELLLAKIHHHFCPPNWKGNDEFSGHVKWPIELWDCLGFLGKL